MKKTILLFLLAFSAGLHAQETPIDQKEVWTDTLNLALMFNQTAFNAEWTGGGTSNIAGEINLDYQLHYEKNNWLWDSRFAANYGLTYNEDDKFARKTSDRLDLHSTVARQLGDSNWYGSFFGNFSTQFAKGYEYFEDAGTGEVRRREVSHFLSPGYLQFGPGFLWKKSNNLKVNFAPATARFIFVDEEFTSYPDYVDGQYFGVDAGESSRFEFGASISAYVKHEIMTNVGLEHILNLYSNYLDEPSNVDIDYTFNLAMNINKYLSTNLVFQAIYDDNAVAGFQIRESFGLALIYKM